MKKIVNVLAIGVVFMGIITCSIAGEKVFDAKLGIETPYTPAEGSIEELYKDIIVTQLTPHIEQVIEEAYGIPLLFDLFDVEFLSIKRDEYRGFSFIVKLQVKPFVGAHNVVGIDDIIVSITPEETKVIEFEHLKSFPLSIKEEENNKVNKLKYTSN